MENDCETLLSLFKRQQCLCLSVTRSSGVLTEIRSAVDGASLPDAIWR